MNEYIFISYPHTSLDTVLSDARWLESQQVQLWHDGGLRGGVDWQNEIATAIQNSAAVMCYISEEFLLSQHCLNELSFSVGCNKPMIPVFESEARLSPGMQLSLGRTQSLFKYQLSEHDFKEQVLEAIALALDRANGREVPGQSKDAVESLVAWSSNFRSNAADVQAMSREKCSLVIEPFVELSNADEDSFIAESMTEDLNTFLSRNPDIDVVNLSVAEQAGDVIEAAARLGVQYLVRGGLAIRGEKMQLRAKLVDVNSRITLWSERYVRSAQDLFELQGDLIRDLAGVIGPAIWHSEGQRISRQNPNSLKVWELIHEANYVQFNMYRRETADEAEALTRQALSMDPDYAVGLATLAQILANKITFCLSDDPKRDMAEASELASRALALAPHDPRVMLFAGVLQGTTGNLSGGIHLAQASAEIDPAVGALGFLGILLIFTGQPGEGIKLIKEELAHDPRSGRRFLSLNNLAMGYMAMGEKSLAKTSLEEALALHPRSHMTYLSYALCLEEMGDRVGAVSALRQVQVIEPSIPMQRYIQSATQLIGGEPSSARMKFSILWEDADQSSAF